MLTEFLTKNLDIVFFIYGLAFFAMGIAIFLQPRHKSAFKLAGIIWILGAFGVIHGINEWFDMFTIIRGHQLHMWDLTRAVVLTASFVFLFEFGRRLFCLSFNKRFFSKWMTLVFCVFVFTFFFALKEEHTIWPRYFLCFPGGILTALGFIAYYRKNEAELKPFKARKYFFIAAYSIGIYSVFGGLIVPKADFPPASVINNASFLNLFGVPVQFFRALCAIILAWACWYILGIFNQEIIYKLKADLEELTAAKKKLVRSENLAALGRFSGIMGHEFKNELCAMKNTVYFLQMKLQDGDEKVKKHLGMLDEEIADTERLIDNITSFARNRAPEFKPVDLEDLLSRSIKKLKIPDTIEVITKIEKGLGPVQADEIQLPRVFNNIILNSLEAMAKKGRLTIKAGSSGGWVNIVFEDTGSGIKEEDMKMIFDPFFSTKTRGMGLGLVISKIIIEAHNGTIEIASKAGKGTSVAIRLPIGESKNV
ncbi:MAG: ATP-binding protein [Candidatus Omnitrophica bacterium]|nr:ATP-binding protein [Candidatus Omnitrophota bacterium]